MRYPALIDGEQDAYGVVFPDIPGVVAMGHTIDDAMLNAGEALRDYAAEMERDGLPLKTPSALEDVEVPDGSVLTSIRLIHTSHTKPSVRLNLSLDADVADAITSEARRRGMTRKNFIEWMVRYTTQTSG